MHFCTQFELKSINLQKQPTNVAQIALKPGLGTWRLVSWKSLRELNALWALPVYLVFEDFVWEQGKIFWFFKENINRQMSEEMLLNDRRGCGCSFRGCSLDQFLFMGAKNPVPARDSKHWPPEPWPQALPTAPSEPYFCSAATNSY